MTKVFEIQLDSWYECTECGHETDCLNSSLDGPDWCPECRSVDTLEEMEHDNE
jgi:predicted nucleic acid-binding Zn ribbon protein